MRKFLSFLALCAVLLSLTACGSSVTPAQPDDTGNAATQDDAAENASFLVLSQNICFSDYPGENSIANRTERFRQLVQTYQPDIISTQESNPGLCNIYQSLLGQTYTMIAEYPNESGLPTYGTSNTILYRTDRYELLETDTHWLSDTPGQKSQLEGSGGFRSCTWALLKDKLTGQAFIVCNTHLDWGNAEIQQRQFQILWELCADYFSKYPVKSIPQLLLKRWENLDGLNAAASATVLSVICLEKFAATKFKAFTIRLSILVYSG